MGLVQLGPGAILPASDYDQVMVIATTLMIIMIIVMIMMTPVTMTGDGDSNNIDDYHDDSHDDDDSSDNVRSSLVATKALSFSPCQSCSSSERNLLGRFFLHLLPSLSASSLSLSSSTSSSSSSSSSLLSSYERDAC